jgi:hypothetical protein
MDASDIIVLFRGYPSSKVNQVRPWEAIMMNQCERIKPNRVGKLDSDSRQETSVIQSTQTKIYATSLR